MTAEVTSRRLKGDFIESTVVDRSLSSNTYVIEHRWSGRTAHIWYDRQQRYWVVARCEQDGIAQVGAADFVYDREWAEESARAMVMTNAASDWAVREYDAEHGLTGTVPTEPGPYATVCRFPGDALSAHEHDLADWADDGGAR